VSAPEGPIAASSLEAISLRPAARGLAWLGAGEVVAKAFAFAATAYLARVLGPDGFGILAFAAAFAIYFVILVDFGLGVYGTREIARGADVRRLAGDVFLLRLALAVVGAALLFAITPLLGKSPLATATIHWSVFLLFSFGAGLFWVFQGLESMAAVALAGVVAQLVYTAGVLAFVHAPAHLLRVPILQAGGEVGAALFLLVLLVRRGLAPRFVLDPGRLARIFRESTPLAWTRVLRGLLYNGDMLILGFLARDEVVGNYSAAYRVVFALLTINVLMGAALLPLKSRARDRSPAVYGEMIGRLSYATAAAMLPIALGGTLLAGPIVRLLFGEKFGDAALPLAILSWAALILPIGENLRRVLWAFDLAARDARALAISALVLLISCLVLVPRFGAVGAAAATLIAETTILAISVAEVRRLVAPFPLVRPIRPLLVSAIAMSAAVWPARGLGLTVAIPLGAAVYIGTLALQRAIPAEILPRRRGGARRDQLPRA